MKKLRYSSMFSSQIAESLGITDFKKAAPILVGHYCSKNYDWQLVRSDYIHENQAWHLIFEAEVTDEQYIWEQLGGNWHKNQ